MSSNLSARWFWIAAECLFFIACPGPIVQAATLYVCDLDSLVHLSTDVVEAEIMRSYEAHGRDLIDVKVTLIHKGRL